MALLLLQAACDPNLQDREGRTALHIGAAMGHVSTLGVLLDFGADPMLCAAPPCNPCAGLHRLAPPCTPSHHLTPRRLRAPPSTPLAHTHSNATTTTTTSPGATRTSTRVCTMPRSRRVRQPWRGSSRVPPRGRHSRTATPTSSLLSTSLPARATRAAWRRCCRRTARSSTNACARRCRPAALLTPVCSPVHPVCPACDAVCQVCSLMQSQGTSTHIACEKGHAEALRQILRHGADIEAHVSPLEDPRTPLHLASE